MATKLFDPALIGDAGEILDFVSGILEASTEYSIIGKDLDGAIVLWNEGARRNYGYAAAELIGNAGSDILHTPEDVAAGLPRRMREAALREGKWEGMVERVRKSGERFQARVVITPRRNRRGEAIGFLLISRDISGEIRLIERLRQAREGAAGLVACAMDAIVAVDDDQRIVLFNPAAEQMFGYTCEEVIGGPLDRLIPPRFHASHAGHVRAFAASGTTARRMGALTPVSGMRRNGEEFPLEASISQHRVDGRPLLTAILRDVTERREAEEKIRRLNLDLERRVAERTEELETAITELEAFDYSISHDLRAPINRIRGFCDMIREENGGKLDARIDDLLRRIAGAGERMDGLVTDLLSLSVASRRELQKTTFDLGELATGLLLALQQADPARKLEYAVEPGLEVVADRGLMRVLLDNLLRNAWKFSGKRDRTRIEVGRVERGGTRAYFVRDNGVGFDPERAGDLFVPFKRLHSQQEFEGTGIGLATVQRIVRRHGGEAWAEGAVGQGATFFFTLGA